MSVGVDKVVSVMLTTGGEVIFREKTTIASNFGVRFHVSGRWFSEHNLEDHHIFKSILESWVVQNGGEANIGKFTDIMRNMGLLEVAEAILELGNPKTRIILSNTLYPTSPPPLILQTHNWQNRECVSDAKVSILIKPSRMGNVSTTTNGLQLSGEKPVTCENCMRRCSDASVSDPIRRTGMESVSITENGLQLLVDKPFISTITCKNCLINCSDARVSIPTKIKRRCGRNRIIVGVIGIVLIVITIGFVYNCFLPLTPTRPSPPPNRNNDTSDGLEADGLLAFKESDRILYKDFKNIEDSLRRL